MGIANPQAADPAALTPAQLAPARQFRQWLAQRLAATDWAEATQARRARVLWLEVLASQSFSCGLFSY
ncbi:hypothetical protein GCM10027422_27580 [Hymenobacter arcticus]